MIGERHDMSFASVRVPFMATTDDERLASRAQEFADHTPWVEVFQDLADEVECWLERRLSELSEPVADVSAQVEAILETAMTAYVHSRTPTRTSSAECSQRYFVTWTWRMAT